MIGSPNVVFVAKRKSHSPLRTRFAVSRTALALAGGRTALLELFASRLRGFSREQGDLQKVGQDHFCTWRRPLAGEGPQQWFYIFAPRDIQPPVNVEAELETYDSLREIHPDDFELDLSPDDPLLTLHSTLSALIRDWPEIAPRIGTVPRRRRA